MMNPNNYEAQQNRAKYRKIVLIDKRGGACQKCGYSKNINALEFHHTRDKSFTLDSRRLSNTSWSKILSEFKKCILLCANCHRETHYPELTIDTVRENLTEKYNPIPPPPIPNSCIDCKNDIKSKSDRCVSCSGIKRRKIKYPPIDWMKKMINQYSRTALSRRLGVSDNAIKKHISKNESGP
jgi:hypothetical protein